MAHGAYRQPTLTEQVQTQSTQSLHPRIGHAHAAATDRQRAWGLAEKPFCVCQGCARLSNPAQPKVHHAELETECAPASQQLTLAMDPCFALHPEDPTSILIIACSCRANTGLHVPAELPHGSFLWLLLDWWERPQPRLGPK